MRYPVVIAKGERNYSAYVPDLPGCVSVGDTLDEAKAEIRAAPPARPICALLPAFNHFDAPPKVALAAPQRANVLPNGVKGVIHADDHTGQHVHIGAQRTRIVLQRYQAARDPVQIDVIGYVCHALSYPSFPSGGTRRRRLHKPQGLKPIRVLATKPRKLASPSDAGPGHCAVDRRSVGYRSVGPAMEVRRAVAWAGR